MQTLRTIRRLLDQADSRPVKRFGQCFLIDKSLMQIIVDLADVQPGDTVLEVGPGTGSLTEELLTRAKKVVAVEIDRKLGPMLESHFAEAANFTLLNTDVLATKHRIAPEVLAAVGPRATMVANLPYSIATSLIVELLLESWRAAKGEGVRFDSLTFIVQDEVAQRLAARKGGEYGATSVYVALLGEIQLGRVLPGSSFWPAPKVESRLVRIDFDPEQAAKLDDINTLQALLGMIFTQRRKRIATTAGARNAPFTKVAMRAAMEIIGIDIDARADQVTPEQYRQLANELGSTEL